MRYLLAVLIFWLTHAPCASAIEASYANLFDEKISMLSVGLNQITLVDVVVPATQCDINAEFECIASKVMVFAVPKSNAHLKAWSHDGASYKILSSQEIVLFGELIKYQRIQQKWKSLTVEYAYSNERGVIGIKARNGHQLLLTTKCGFGAISDVHQCKSKGPGSH